MNNTQQEDTLKEMMEVFKEDYHSPTKVIVWAKAVKAWGGIIFGGILFLLVVSIIFGSFFIENRKKNALMNQAALNIASHLKETVTFIDVGKRSMEKRAEIMKTLMQLAGRFEDQSFNQKAVEKRLASLISLYETCKEARRGFVEEFSESQNPHQNAGTAEPFEKLIDDGSFFYSDKPKAITLEEENEQWGNLCFLCNREIKRTHEELHKISNVQAPF